MVLSSSSFTSHQNLEPSEDSSLLYQTTVYKKKKNLFGSAIRSKKDFGCFQIAIKSDPVVVRKSNRVLALAPPFFSVWCIIFETPTIGIYKHWLSWAININGLLRFVLVYYFRQRLFFSTSTLSFLDLPFASYNCQIFSVSFRDIERGMQIQLNQSNHVK